MIRKGPNTRVRISRGWRKISVNSLLRKEEVRIRNLSNLLIVAFLFDQLHEHIVIGRQDFFNRFYINSFHLTGFDQSWDGCTCLINNDLEFLITDHFDLAVYKGQAFQLLPALKP